MTGRQNPSEKQNVFLDSASFRSGRGYESHPSLSQRLVTSSTTTLVDWTKTRVWWNGRFFLRGLLYFLRIALAGLCTQGPTESRKIDIH